MLIALMHYLLYFVSYSNATVMSDTCVFCKGEEDDPVEKGKLGEKAVATLQSAAKSARQDLPEGCVPGATYHNKCKRRLIRAMESSSAAHGSLQKKPRVAFPFRTNCMYCGVQVAKFADIDMKVISQLINECFAGKSAVTNILCVM